MKTRPRMKKRLEILRELLSIQHDLSKHEDSDDHLEGWVEALCFVLGLEVCDCSRGIEEKGFTSCSTCLDIEDKIKGDN